MKVVAWLGIVASWIALVVSFAFAIPDRETLGLSGAEAWVGRSMSTAELYFAVAAVTLPWLLIVHLLSRYKQKLKGPSQ